jgi:hypothetical protein
VATSTVPSTHNPNDALREYLALREELTELERHEAECSCDVNEFHTCEFCRDYGEKNHRAKSLIDLWGDAWAVQLGKLRAGEGNRTFDPAIDCASLPNPNFSAAATNAQNPAAAARATASPATGPHLARASEYCRDYFEEVCRG